MRALAVACVLALAAFGCKEKEQTPQTETTTPTTPATATQAAAPANTAAATDTAAAAVDNADLPTEEDFEEEAATDITPDNLDTELDKLEKEIGG